MLMSVIFNYRMQFIIYGWYCQYIDWKYFFVSEIKGVDCINYKLISILISNIELLIYIAVVIFVMKKLLN